MYLKKKCCHFIIYFSYNSSKSSKYFRLKTTEVVLESFPQLLLNLFIIMSLQINEPLNWVSTSASFVSVLYGVSVSIASFKHGNNVPVMSVVWAVLASFLDVSFGLFLTAYIFSLYKAYGFVFPSTSILVTLIATCILWKMRPRGQSQEGMKYSVSFFVSFASKQKKYLNTSTHMYYRDYNAWQEW